MIRLIDAETRPFSAPRHDITFDEARAIVFGAPHGTPYPGIDNRPFGATPAVLREVMAEDWAWLDHWDFDLGGPLLGEGGFTIHDAGDLPTLPTEGASNREQIRNLTARIVAAGAAPIMIGGDDSTPIPFIEALAPLGPLTIVQIDAHIDWRDERLGEPMGFSSTMRRASEMPHVERIVQVGMRGVGSARPEEVDIARSWGAQIVTARELHTDGVDAVTRHIPTGSVCLITFDCDALDAGIMPAVKAPTPGGLSYTQAIDLVAAVAAKGRLAAFDLIEFVPERDPNRVAALTAARILCNAIGAMARNS
ncbi:MAG: arginase family protein [Pseudomonadota bacterium]